MTRVRETTLATIMEEVERLRATGARKPDGTRPDGPWVIDLMAASWLELCADERDEFASHPG